MHALHLVCLPLYLSHMPLHEGIRFNKIFTSRRQTLTMHQGRQNQLKQTTIIHFLQVRQIY